MKERDSECMEIMECRVGDGDGIRPDQYGARRAIYTKKYTCLN
jgi:hypothetical protein